MNKLQVQERVQILVAVVIRFVRSINRNAYILRLLLGQFRQLHSKLVQMCSRYLLIQLKKQVESRFSLNGYLPSSAT